MSVTVSLSRRDNSLFACFRSSSWYLKRKRGEERREEREERERKERKEREERVNLNIIFPFLRDLFSPFLFFLSFSLTCQIQLLDLLDLTLDETLKDKKNKKKKRGKWEEKRREKPFIISDERFNLFPFGI